MPRGINLVHGQTILVTVRSRETTYFTGKAATLTSLNDTGPFDILPRHTHFISLIRDGVTIKKPDGTEKHISFSHGIIKVKDDVVEVYIGTGRRQ
ncbi:MAG: Uncharacterized protein G01um101429_242 [Parcubacteria group bacterium Gr01-1014_29]|nr:MAG: Uncharacterized protein G01um101429_242 [Parcubacteria group bacterium Gr01-1014_29]